jgi:hypothetical protein
MKRWCELPLDVESVRFASGMPSRRSLQDGIPYLLPRIARAALATGRELLAKSQQYNSDANVDVVCAVLRGRQLREAAGAQRPFVTNGLSDASGELSQLHRASLTFSIDPGNVHAPGRSLLAARVD